jgi:hypothetical protein
MRNLVSRPFGGSRCPWAGYATNGIAVLLLIGQVLNTLSFVWISRIACAFVSISSTVFISPCSIIALVTFSLAAVDWLVVRGRASPIVGCGS